MERTAEADPEMTHVVELSDRDFKITLINVLEDLVNGETTRVNTQGRGMKSVKEPS